MWMNFLEESYNGLLVLWFAYKRLTCEQSYLDSTFKQEVTVQNLNLNYNIDCFFSFTKFVNLTSIFFVYFPSYMFDEPSSYLDVKQRLKCALTIRSLLSDDRYCCCTYYIDRNVQSDVNHMYI